MLSPMHFDFQIENKEDLEHFQTLFHRNVGIEQMLYNFYTDGVMVRIQVNGLEGSQIIKIGFFNYHKQDSSTSLTQFCPSIDSRFASFDEIQGLCEWNANVVWGTFTHTAAEVDASCNALLKALIVVHKVCKLKAFL